MGKEMFCIPVNENPLKREYIYFLCRLNECSWRHIAIQILYVRPSVKVSVNLFQIAPVRTGSLQL